MDSGTLNEFVITPNPGTCAQTLLATSREVKMFIKMSYWQLSGTLAGTYPYNHKHNLHVGFVDSSHTQYVKVIRLQYLLSPMRVLSKLISCISISNYLSSRRLSVAPLQYNQRNCSAFTALSYTANSGWARTWSHLIMHRSTGSEMEEFGAESVTLNSLLFSFTNSLGLSQPKTTMCEFLN